MKDLEDGIKDVKYEGANDIAFILNISSQLNNFILQINVDRSKEMSESRYLQSK